MFRRLSTKSLINGLIIIISFVAFFSGLPDDVTTAVHLCCGYPEYLDQDDYKKADKNLYIELAKLLDASGLNQVSQCHITIQLQRPHVFQVSIEDAEAINDVEKLLPNFKKISVIFGSIAVARSKTEDFDNLKKRIADALKHIDPNRLILAPDCGLGYLTEDMIKSKLEVMVKVAKEF